MARVSPRANRFYLLHQRRNGFRNLDRFRWLFDDWRGLSRYCRLGSSTCASRRNEIEPAPPSPALTWTWDSSTNADT